MCPRRRNGKQSAVRGTRPRTSRELTNLGAATPRGEILEEEEKCRHSSGGSMEKNKVTKPKASRPVSRKLHSAAGAGQRHADTNSELGDRSELPARPDEFGPGA